MKAIHHFLLIFVLMGSVVLVSAQMMPPMMRLPELHGQFTMPTVGAWAEYRVVNQLNEEDRESTMKLSIVDEEEVEGETYYWYEVVTEDEKGQSVIKMLISGDPKDFENIRRMIIKAGDVPAMEIPSAWLRMGQRMDMEAVEPEEEEQAAPTKVKKEKVKTPAGTLQSSHIQVVDNDGETAEVWTSQDIPFFGLAKAVTSSTMMEVMGYGKTGAKSAIREQPQEIQIPDLAPGSIPK